MKTNARWMVCGLACLLAAGCAKPPAPPGPPSQNLQAIKVGYDAYRAGDQTALENQIQTLAALLPADEAAQPIIGCSPQSYALRRIERAKRKLEYLDKQTVWSMGEEERYVYFQQLVDDRYQQLSQALSLGVDQVGGSTDFECQADPDYQQSTTLDVQEQDAVYQAGRTRERVWLNSLRASFDDQLDARMQNAVLELRDYKLRGSADPWQAPLWPR